MDIVPIVVILAAVFLNALPLIVSPNGFKRHIMRKLAVHKSTEGKVDRNIHTPVKENIDREIKNLNRVRKKEIQSPKTENANNIRSTGTTTTPTTPSISSSRSSTITPVVPVSQNIPSDTQNSQIRNMFRITDVEESNPMFRKALLANRLNEDHEVPPEFKSSIVPIDDIILQSTSNNNCAFCNFFHNVKERLVLTEGDQMMKYDDFLYFYGNGSTSRTKRALLPASRNRGWPSNTMPVDADLTYGSRDIDEIIKALREWNTYTCMKFRDLTDNDKSSNRPRVKFIGRDSGCYSFIGRQGGQQIIQLLSQCRTKRTVVHEVGHAIGFFHEHVRPDRDNFVEILYNNIPANAHFNFRRVNDADSLGVPYDYLSIMHYSEKAFARNGNGITIRAKDSRYQQLMGRATQLSFRDVKQANAFLGCARGCQQKTCPGEGFLDKNCQCRCPSVFEPSAPCDGSTPLQATDPRISRFPTDLVNFEEEIRTVKNFQELFNRIRNVANSTSAVNLPAFK